MAIHYLKARNSDFLAGVDLEIFELEGKPKILKVKKVEYKENFKVNGRLKPKGVIFYFEEAYAKPLIVNTTNSSIIKDKTGVIDLEKCVGFSIEFYFNTKVEMKISKTETRRGGIRIKDVDTNGLTPSIEDIKSTIEKATSKAQLMSIWRDLSEKDQIIYKEEAANKHKTFK